MTKKMHVIGIKFWEIGRQIMEIQGNNPLKIMCRPPLDSKRDMGYI